MGRLQEAAEIQIAGIAQPGRNGQVSADRHPSVEAVIAAYHIRWDEVTNGYHFAGRTGEQNTPLLDALKKRLELRVKPRTVIDAAAGSGDHTIALASQVEHAHIYAVDSNPKATTSLRAKLADPTIQLREGSKVAVETVNIFDHLGRRRRQRRFVDAFYANSFVHVLPIAERRRLYAFVRGLQSQGGLIAVSFKAQGDAMQGKGRTAGKDKRGVYETDKYGLRRLFVSHTEPLMQELQDVGYNVTPVEPWSTPDYDFKGGIGKFVGFYGIKR